MSPGAVELELRQNPQLLSGDCIGSMSSRAGMRQHAEWLSQDWPCLAINSPFGTRVVMD